MAETKYGKYFLSQPKPGEKRSGFGSRPQTIIWTDNDVIEGSHLFWALRLTPDWTPAVHGPHTHKDPELIVM